jgi:hypothetical protein
MAFPFGQGLFDLSDHGRDWPTFPFEKSQAIPKTYDFSLSSSVHIVSPGICPNVNEKRTKHKTLMVGAVKGQRY